MIRLIRDEEICEELAEETAWLHEDVQLSQVEGLPCEELERRYRAIAEADAECDPDLSAYLAETGELLEANCSVETGEEAPDEMGDARHESGEQ